MDVVEAIVKVPTDSRDEPLVPAPLKIEIIRIDSAAMPGFARM